MTTKYRNKDRHKSRTRAELALKVREIRDEGMAIDAALAEARKRVDWKRRRRAEKSLAAWLSVYGVGVFIDDPPPAHGVEILAEMEAAVGDSRPYQILMARGHGKTSYAEACAAFALATGRRKFCAVSAANSYAAKRIVTDITRLFVSEPFATDYPDIACPVVLLDGHYKREQRQAGHSVGFECRAGECVFPTITDEDGEPVATSGSVIKARPLKTIRGTRHGTLRPDIVILDDLQTTEIAHNPTSVDQLLGMIRGEVMGLAGKYKSAIICTATSIAPEDLTDRLRTDKVWKTTEFKAFVHWPKDWAASREHGLWAQYFALFDGENAADQPHDGSRKFYKANRAAMDEGADVLNPTRFSKRDGQVSAVQALMDKMHEMGDAAFMAEFQMKPTREVFAVQVSPSLISSRVNNHPALAVPQGVRLVVAATDVNPSYALTTSLVAFAADSTAYVIGHFVKPVKIDLALNDSAFGDALFTALSEHGRELAALGVKIGAWGIDASGTQRDAVTAFARAQNAAGRRVLAMMGRASHKFIETPRNRIAACVNRTVMVGDALEMARPGAGVQLLYWDADLYKERVHRAFISEVGAPGGCSLYAPSRSNEHSEFAIQVSKEKLRGKTENSAGQTLYTWKSEDPHDYLDSTAMCFSLAGREGMSAASTMGARRIGLAKPAAIRRKVRIV